MKQVKLSDILESVAAKYESGEYSGYSCNRVDSEIDNVTDTFSEFLYLNRTFAEGVMNMGLDVGSDSEFDDVEDEQQARMLWLTWCAMMARGQGL